MMNFALMEYSLLYLREEDVTPKLSMIFDLFSETSHPFMVLVQLKKTKAAVKPTLAKMIDIRSHKINKKLQLLGNKSFKNRSFPEVKIIEQNPNNKQLTLSFQEDDCLMVYCNPYTVDKILPFLHQIIDVKKVKFINYAIINP